MTDTDTEAPAEKPAPEPHSPCLCGCGGVPIRKRSRFLPGHDAQLKAALYRTIRDVDTSDEDKASAKLRLAGFGWPEPVERKAKAKPAEDAPTEG